jgi:hypothetical protein
MPSGIVMKKIIGRIFGDLATIVLSAFLLDFYLIFFTWTLWYFALLPRLWTVIFVLVAILFWIILMWAFMIIIMKRSEDRSDTVISKLVIVGFFLGISFLLLIIQVSVLT